MSSTPIPNTSAFPTMPAFPSIRAQADTSVTQSPLPELNRIYFNKKTLKETKSYYDFNIDQNVVRKIWEIPFSCNADTPVAELTQRIDAAMEKIKVYDAWKIDYSQFIIKATEK